MIRPALLLFVLLLPSSHGRSEPQVTYRHGTIIVVFFSKDRVVLAADSRLTLSGGRSRYSDTQCKLSDLGHETIFAGAGMYGYDFGSGPRASGFDAYKAALKSSQSLQPGLEDRAKAVAEDWSRKVKAAIDPQLARHPAEVLASMHGSSMLLAQGVFAGRTADGLVTYFAAIHCDCSGAHKSALTRLTQLHPTADGLPLASLGTTEALNLFSEVVEGSSQRGLDERASWEKISGPGRDGEVAFKTAEFIVRNVKDRSVGGLINAIELDHDGNVRWVKRGNNCQSQP
jgi:ATP-dependent protease HslVU (ClpYQ) peptidase subunit